MSYAKTGGQQRKALARKACSLRVFFKYLTNYTRQLDVNPVLNLDTPKTKIPAEIFDPEQSVALLQSADGKFAERDYCILTLCLTAGCGAPSWWG